MMKELPAIIFSLINERKWEELLGYFSENAVFVFPGTSSLSSVYEGKDQLKRFFRKMVIVVPDLTFHVENIIASGEFAAVVWQSYGRTRKGLSYNNQGVTIIMTDQGKIIYMRDYLDTEKLK